MTVTMSRLASRQFHHWLVPEKTVLGMFSLGIILIFIGAVLLAVASVSTGALAIIGGVLLGVGLLLLLISLCLCAHAWCVWYVKDNETQTIETTIVGGDQMDGDWFPAYGTADKRVPNGVLRDGKQSGGTLTKKHVTISPRSDSFSSGYMSGRQADSLRSGGDFYGGKSKSGPSSVSSDMSTLASFKYLNDPSLATPYSSLNMKRQQQSGNVQPIPVHVQDGYGTAQRNSDFGRTAQVRPYYTDQNSTLRSNVLPVRRHSDDDYDNAGDVTALLPHQTYYQEQPSPWQQQGMPLAHTQDGIQYSQQWQHSQQPHQQPPHQQPQQPQQPQQQTVWQYQTSGGAQQQKQQQFPQQQFNWRPPRPSNEEMPPSQPLVRPSQRRPMTFEQISSSKVSLYDNIHMNRPDEEEE